LTYINVCSPRAYDQAPVWSHQSALPGFEEEHPAVDDPVCAVQLMNVAQQIDAGAGMSALANRQKAQKMAKRPNRPEKQGKFRPYRKNIRSVKNTGRLLHLFVSCSGHS
jgi:hypothetical protein